MIRYLIAFALFYVLTPGVLLTLPRGGSKTTVALTHAAIFIGVYYLAERLAEMLGAKNLEFDFDVDGFRGGRGDHDSEYQQRGNMRGRERDEDHGMKDGHMRGRERDEDRIMRAPRPSTSIVEKVSKKLRKW